MKPRTRTLPRAAALFIALGAPAISPLVADERAGVRLDRRDVRRAGSTTRPPPRVVTAAESRAVWEDGRIYTYTHVRVDSRGRRRARQPGAEAWVRTMGGVVGKVGQIVEGEAAFAPGRPSLLFLRPGPVGAYVVTDRGQGQFPVVTDDRNARARRPEPRGRDAGPAARSHHGRARPGSPQTCSTAARSTTSRKRSPPPGAPRMLAERADDASSSLQRFDPDVAEVSATGPSKSSAAMAAADGLAARRARRAFCRTTTCPFPAGFVPTGRRVRSRGLRQRGARRWTRRRRTCRSSGATPASATTSSERQQAGPVRQGRRALRRRRSRSGPTRRARRRGTGASASTCRTSAPSSATRSSTTPTRATSTSSSSTTRTGPTPRTRQHAGADDDHLRPGHRGDLRRRHGDQLRPERPSLARRSGAGGRLRLPEHHHPRGGPLPRHGPLRPDPNATMFAQLRRWARRAMRIAVAPTTRPASARSTCPTGIALVDPSVAAGGHRSRRTPAIRPRATAGRASARSRWAATSPGPATRSRGRDSPRSQPAVALAGCDGARRRARPPRM